MDGGEAREEVPRRYEVADVPGYAPRTEPALAGSEPALVDPAEHNVVFTNLVTGDHDIVGLVAYSIYKQNKYDWLQAFGRQQGRMPNAEEAQSYLLGESTPRRLGPAGLGGATRRAGPNWQIGSGVLVMLGIALLALIVMFWLLRSGAPLPPATPGK